MKRCPAYGKIVYNSFSEALAALEKMEQAFEGGEFTGRTYQCISCGQWHVSKKIFDLVKPKGRGKRRKRLVPRAYLR